MEKQDEKLEGLEAELAEMDVLDAVVENANSEREDPLKKCNLKA